MIKGRIIVNPDRIIPRLEFDSDAHRIKQPGDSSDDEVHRPSARSESAPNLGIPLIAAPGNPLQAQDEYENRDSSRSTLAELSTGAAH